MDRRQMKTRKAIFCAFRTLLEKKKYDHITVGDIIEAADVGRSTFYSHFETKDALLEAMCSEIFHHVFEGAHCPWQNKGDSLEIKLAHTLWHIKESRSDLVGILLSDGGELFMSYFKKHLLTLFEEHLSEFSLDVPKDFLLNHLASSTCEAVKWWVGRKFCESPEKLASDLIKALKR